MARRQSAWKGPPLRRSISSTPRPCAQSNNNFTAAATHRHNGCIFQSSHMSRSHSVNNAITSRITTAVWKFKAYPAGAATATREQRRWLGPSGMVVAAGPGAIFCSKVFVKQNEKGEHFSDGCHLLTYLLRFRVQRATRPVSGTVSASPAGSSASTCRWVRSSGSYGPVVSVGQGGEGGRGGGRADRS